jgi:type 1 glutamine amidotransferase
MGVINRDDVPVAIQDDSAELRTAEAGDMTVAFMTLKKGADFAPALSGLPDDLCQCPHWGFMIKGRLKMKTNDGDEIYEAGQVFYWSPGHSPEALEDTEYVDFSPTQEFNAVIRHIQGQA